jgi:hypothetical protein
MIARIWSGGIVLFWLAAMSWLIRTDVWPAWTAREPPTAVSPDWVQGRSARQQARIDDKYGQRMGTIWTVYSRSGQNVSREDVIYLHRFPIPDLPSLRVEIESQFDPQGRLDEIDADVYGPQIHIELNGERFASQIAFELRAGTYYLPFRLDDVEAGMIGDAFKPFSAMPGLEVGQSWRMQVFNPLATIFPQFGDKFIPMLVRVTGRETIQTPEGPVDCLVVEAANALAKVGPDGTVYYQEMELPVGGRITIQSEPFDEWSLRRAKAISLQPSDP